MERFIDDIINNVKDASEASTATCYSKLICIHQDFNRPGIFSFTRTSSIEMVFDSEHYTLTGESSGNSITKLYHQIPSPEEFNYILQAEAQAHLLFIEQRVALEKF